MSAGSSIRLRGVPLRVPTHVDEKTTQTIASKLDQRLQDIEDGAERIDSLGFALRLAYDLAVELDALQSDAEANLKDVLRHLDRLKGRLESLSERLENPPDTTPAPEQ